MKETWFKNFLATKFTPGTVVQINGLYLGELKNISVATEDEAEAMGVEGIVFFYLKDSDRAISMQYIPDETEFEVTEIKITVDDQQRQLWVIAS